MDGSVGGKEGFLCLTRRKDQEIVLDVLGARVVIRVLRTRGREVELGFQAPESVRIFRSELLKTG